MIDRLVRTEILSLKDDSYRCEKAPTPASPEQCGEAGAGVPTATTSNRVPPGRHLCKVTPRKEIRLAGYRPAPEGAEPHGSSGFDFFNGSVGPKFRRPEENDLSVSTRCFIFALLVLEQFERHVFVL